MINTAMALAIYRKRLQVIHHEHDDGSISFDLQHEPEQQVTTIN